MAPSMLALIPLLLASSTAATTGDAITAATREMQKANYFAFVMLINMAPPDITQGGITFLMPNDRALSKTAISESAMADFLLRHSIPSPFLMEHLMHLPTGSTLPSSKPGLVFRVTNDGRKHFFLSNVRIVSPNICTLGLLIRCHGIDGVAQPNPPTTCPSNVSQALAPPPSVMEVSPPPKSGSRANLGFDVVLLMLFMLGVMGLWS